MIKKNKIILLVFIFISILISGCSKTFNNHTSSNTVKDIKNRGTLIVGTSADFPPNEFHTMINGVDTIVGSDIELAKYIANELKVDLEIKDMEFSNLLGSLSTGMVDIVIAGMSPKPERDINFSNIYDVGDSHKMLIRNSDKNILIDEKDFQGKVIGAQTGSLQKDFANTIDDTDIIELPDINNLIMQLKTNKIDGIVMSNDTAESYVLNNKDLTISSSIEFISEHEGSAIGIKKGNDDLTNEINNIIDRVLDENLYLKWKEDAKKLSDKEIE